MAPSRDSQDQSISRNAAAFSNAMHPELLEHAGLHPFLKTSMR
jgi:hypothetical protein